MTSSSLNLEILSGAQADALLAKDAFAREWAQVLASCPWATGFQSPAFALTWYRTYRPRYEPWLVISRDANGTLQALLPLARRDARGDFVAAGHIQAEYQTWICAPALGDAFPAATVRAIRAAVPGAAVRFEFLPPQTPVAWLEQPDVKRLAVLHTHRRPLMQFGDGSAATQSLKKSGNKSRLRQLRRLGEMQFKRITDPAEFAAEFALVAQFYDSRHVVLRDVAPFEIDPFKQPFHVEMIKTPGLLHVGVLKFGPHLASAHVGIAGPAGGGMALAMVAHNPTMSRLSPGKIHLLLLAQSLHAEGYAQLDLTCGGESYKERFANAWDEVNTLSLLPSSTHRAMAAMRERTKGQIKAALRRWEIKPTSVTSAWADARRIGAAKLAHSAGARARRWISSRTELRIYSQTLDAATSPTAPPTDRVHRDSVADLLSYAPLARWEPSRQAFMSAAVDRMEAGHHVYTTLDDNGAAPGRVEHLGYLADELPEDAAATIADAWRPQPNSVIALDLHAMRKAPPDRIEHLTRQCLLAMRRDAIEIHHARTMHILVRGDDDATRRIVERDGFACEQVLVEETTLGRRRRRAMMPTPPALVLPTTTPATPARSLKVPIPKPTQASDESASLRMPHRAVRI